MGLITFIQSLSSVIPSAGVVDTDDGLWHDDIYFDSDDGNWNDDAYFPEDDGNWHDDIYF